MRIELVEPDGRRRRRKGGRSPAQTFDIAIAQPRRQADKGRGARRSQTRSRPRARERAARAETSIRPRSSGRTFWVRLPALLLLAGLIAATVYLSLDPRFYVYEAQIVGAHHLEAQAIYRRSGVDEHHIFWIEPQQVAGQISQMPGIKAVRVRCALPAQVTIEVEEREPVVLWRALAQGRDWWLDEEGVVLPYHGDVNSPTTLFVVDSSQRFLQVGERLTPEGIVHSVQQWAAALPGIRVFFYDAERGLSFTHQAAGGQWPVYVGDSRDLQRKIEVVQALHERLRVQGIQPRYVDVRWADHPAYGKPIAQESGGGH